MSMSPKCRSNWNKWSTKRAQGAVKQERATCNLSTPHQQHLQLYQLYSLCSDGSSRTYLV